MITTVAQFVAENNKRKKLGLPSLNENFMDTDALSNEEGVEETEIDNETENEFGDETEDAQDAPVVTLDAFKEALSAKFNEYMENLEEGAEEVEMLTDLQMQLAFDAYQSIVPTEEVQGDEEFTDENEEPIDGDDFSEEDGEEPVQEGLFGPSKEEIEAGRKGAEERLRQLENTHKGKTMTFMEKGDNKQVPYTYETAMEFLKKKNYRGVIKSINQGDKVVLIFEPAKTLLQKIAAGTTTSTVGA